MNNWLAKLSKIGFTQHYQREAFFFLILGFSAFTYCALLSFSPLDISQWTGASPKSAPTNLAGEFGAWLSAFLFHYLGIVAFIAPVPVLLYGLSGLNKSISRLSLARPLGWLAAFSALVSIAALIFPIWLREEIPMPGGGLLGFVFADFGTSGLGKLGGAIVLTTLIATSTILLLQRSILAGLAKLRLDLSSWRKKSVEQLEKIQPTPMAATATPSLPSLTSNEPAIFNIPPSAPITPLASLEQSQKPNEAQGPYTPPPSSIFRTSSAIGPLSASQRKEYEATADLLVKTFADFAIQGSVVAIQPGPVVTVFEFQPDAGTKLAKINSLVDDLALALRVDSIIMHPVRGKRAVGIQVPNANRELVRLGDVLSSEDFLGASSPLTLGLGKAIAGEPVCADLTKMPHLLMAGATGAGKSVAINSLLCSLIMKSSPSTVRLILVDPKMLELSVYEGIPHLLMPVITAPARASIALKWVNQEMERRYKLMQTAKVRNIGGFNEFWERASEDQKIEIRDSICDDEISKLPYIVVVIDELADLMLTAPKDVESLIQRLAQKARASGIHLVLATQRPSVDVITGVIKANLPCRAAFQVVSKHDSRTILDQNGADKLLGQGDMLIQRPGAARLERIQGAFISDEEVLELVESLKSSTSASYHESAIQWIDDEVKKETQDPAGVGGDSEDDPKYDMAVHIAASQGQVSASFLQRQLKIGYNRAARIVETMQSQGLVAPAEGSKPRKWIGPPQV